MYDITCWWYYGLYDMYDITWRWKDVSVSFAFHQEHHLVPSSSHLFFLFTIRSKTLPPFSVSMHTISPQLYFLEYLKAPPWVSHQEQGCRDSLEPDPCCGTCDLWKKNSHFLLHLVVVTILLPSGGEQGSKPKTPPPTWYCHLLESCFTSETCWFVIWKLTKP